jgi:eukaryotic-like serine/threonine-protein kinase
MERASVSELHPALLPAGTVLGCWRVVAWGGQGVHGAVYRAVRVGQEQTPAVALKLALLPEAPRMTREAQLLARLRHPSIPRLWDSGTWRGPGEMLHPFLVMDWVDGAPLYEQALYPRTSPHVARMLALNGGCWLETPLDREACEATASSGHMGIMVKNKCYLPALRHGRQPSSSPPATP